MSPTLLTLCKNHSRSLQCAMLVSTLSWWRMRVGISRAGICKKTSSKWNIWLRTWLPAKYPGLHVRPTPKSERQWSRRIVGAFSFECQTKGTSLRNYSKFTSIISHWTTSASLNSLISLWRLVTANKWWVLRGHKTTTRILRSKNCAILNTLPNMNRSTTSKINQILQHGWLGTRGPSFICIISRKKWAIFFSMISSGIWGLIY